MTTRHSPPPGRFTTVGAQGNLNKQTIVMDGATAGPSHQYQQNGMDYEETRQPKQVYAFDDYDTDGSDSIDELNNSQPDLNWSASTIHNGKSTPKRKRTDINTDILTKNRFSPLQLMQDNSSSMKEEIHNAVHRDNNNSSKIRFHITNNKISNNNNVNSKIPPVIFRGPPNEPHSTFINSINSKLTNNVKIKTNKNMYILYTNNINDYDVLLNILKEKKIEHYTHTPKTRKPVKMVLKGLPYNITIDEVKHCLEEKINIISIKQFTKKDLTNNTIKNVPVYTVIFPPNTNINDIIKIKEICYCLVNWEKFKSKNAIIQCYKCQSFGHVAYNCFKSMKCLKCGGPHSIKNCVSDTTLKCTNCKGQHLANSKQCVVYNRVIESISNKRSVVNAQERRGLFSLNQVVNNSNTIVNDKKTYNSTNQIEQNRILNDNTSNRTIKKSYAETLFKKNKTNDTNIENNNLNLILTTLKSVNLSKILVCLKTILSILNSNTDSDISTVIITIIQCIADTFM